MLWIASEKLFALTLLFLPLSMHAASYRNRHLSGQTIRDYKEEQMMPLLRSKRPLPSERTLSPARTVSVLVAALAAAAVPACAARDVNVHVAPGSKPLPGLTDNYPTIQMALDHAPQPGPGGRLFIHIAPGTYAERVMVTANRPRTTFLGEGGDPAAVVITASQNAKEAGGTFFTETVDVEARGFEADGITFANNAGATGQAVAIAVRSDRAVFKHCRFLGYQDTLFADWGRQYYLDSYITGGVDFIFGNASAVFDHTEIHEQTPGFLTAQSRTAPDQPTGFVIVNSTVTSEPLPEGHHFFLGRPWRDYARVVAMHTVLPAALSPQGWSPWHGDQPPANAFYAEWQNSGPGADPSARPTWVHMLSAQQAAVFAPLHFLRGADHWNPQAEAAKLP